MFVDSNLLIYGEVLQEVSHHLLSKAERLEDIRRIYSHPHAIAQCRHWLETNLPQIPVAEAPSTARAAELCADDPTAAAIASELAGELYGLKVFKSRIEDNINNFTRFLVLSKKAPERTGRDKTSIMLSVKDKVGALYDLLRPFASHGINMTKIESRPSRRKAWEYIFFVDIEGHVDEDRVKKALEEIKGRCLFLKILGSYPAHS
jgi:chorismate mutase/prephenate dehydratase